MLPPLVPHKPVVQFNGLCRRAFKRHAGLILRAQGRAQRRISGIACTACGIELLSGLGQRCAGRITRLRGTSSGSARLDQLGVDHEQPVAALQTFRRCGPRPIRGKTIPTAELAVERDKPLADRERRTVVAFDHGDL